MAGDLPTKQNEIKVPAPKVFNCPSCGAGITLRALGQAVSVACLGCGSVIDSTNENYQILSKAAKLLKVEPHIPLGQLGKLHGVPWKVIGFMQRCDGSGMYRWGEYLLFNPARGFRWLTEFDGHWNYIVMTKEKPTQDTSLWGRKTMKYMGKTYFLFHKGLAKVTYVVGEFYWRVKVDETVNVLDFIAPPEMLSLEKSEEEVIWSVAEYMNPDDIRAAFQIESPIPSGVAPNQPSSLATDMPFIGKYWAIFLAVIFTLQFSSMILAKREQVYLGNFAYHSSNTEKIEVSPQFELKHGLSNVRFQFSSPVKNQWLELQADLVNDQTGEIYEFEQGVEYYSGYEDGTYWTEGSQINNVFLSSIPDGLYHLNLEATGSVINTPPPSLPLHITSSYSSLNYSLKVTRDEITWSNFLWAFALISIFPLFVWWRSRSFEMSRWSNSDFSPYYSQQEEDDE